MRRRRLPPSAAAPQLRSSALDSTSAPHVAAGSALPPAHTRRIVPRQLGHLRDANAARHLSMQSAERVMLPRHHAHRDASRQVPCAAEGRHDAALQARRRSARRRLTWAHVPEALLLRPRIQLHQGCTSRRPARDGSNDAPAWSLAITEREQGAKKPLFALCAAITPDQAARGRAARPTERSDEFLRSQHAYSVVPWHQSRDRDTFYAHRIANLAFGGTCVF